MFGNSREDQLLSKLKNCIGSLKYDNPNYQQSQISKQAYNNIKQNYQITAIESSKNFNQNTNIKNSNTNHYQYAERAPLAPSNYINPSSHYPPTSTNYVHPTLNKDAQNYIVRNQQQARQNLKIVESDATPKKFQYRFDRSQKEDKHQNRMIIPPPTESIPRIPPNRQQVRGQISRRYSLMQNNTINPRGSEVYDHQKRVATRNYQQQVQQRKQLLEGAFDRNTLAYQRRQKSPIGSKRQNIGVCSIRKQIKSSTRQIGRAPPSQVIFSSRKNAEKPPIIIKQSIQKVYGTQKDQSQNQCSALLKLRKISELNEKINDRIRNIINVFEEHKC